MVPFNMSVSPPLRWPQASKPEPGDDLAHDLVAKGCSHVTATHIVHSLRSLLNGTRPAADEPVK